MRTTLSIDDDVLEDARRIAAAEGRSVGAVLSALARRSLAPAEIGTRDGLPVFEVAEDAPRITFDQVSQALDE